MAVSSTFPGTFLFEHGPTLLFNDARPSSEIFRQLCDAMDQQCDVADVESVWIIQDEISLFCRYYSDTPLHVVADTLILLKEARKLCLTVSDYANTFVDDERAGVMKITNGGRQLSFLIVDSHGKVERGKIGSLYIYDVEMSIENWKNVEPIDVFAH